MEIKPISVFDSKCNYLVNTVNTVGAMGKGIALEFRLRCPEMYYEYRRKCVRKEIRVGEYWIYFDDKYLFKHILNFPTKKHYANPTKPEYLTSGLEYFRKNYVKHNINSIAFPLLGTKNGKMDLEESMNIMYDILYDLPIEIDICEGYESDKFTLIMKNLFMNKSIDDLSKEFNISKSYCEKIKRKIPEIRFLSELVSEKKIPINTVHLLYSYGLYNISKKKLNKFYVNTQ